MPSEEAMLKTIEKITPLLKEMERDDLVRLWQNTVEEQARSKDTAFQAACEKFLDAIDAEFVSERLKGSYLKEGLLSFLGYHVGRRANLPASKRHAILSAIYRRPAPIFLTSIRKGGVTLGRLSGWSGWLALSLGSSMNRNGAKIQAWKMRLLNGKKI